MKKKGMMAGIIMGVCMWTVPVWGQGYPVIDVAHILESIYNGYQIYQNVQNTLQGLVYSYESMKAHVQQLKAFDYNSLDSFRDMVKFADRQLSYVRNMENRLNGMSITVNGKKIPLKRIYEAPDAIVEAEKEFWTREMTEEEKARAWSHYGLQPVNYYYVQTWKERIKQVSQQLEALSDMARENMESSAKEVEEITEGARGADSTIALLQANVEMQRVLAAQLMRMNYQLTAMGRMQSNEAMKAEHVPQRIPVSSDFLK
jgi:hypothetical protein